MSSLETLCDKQATELKVLCLKFILAVINMDVKVKASASQKTTDCVEHKFARLAVHLQEPVALESLLGRRHHSSPKLH